MVTARLGERLDLKIAAEFATDSAPPPRSAPDIEFIESPELENPGLYIRDEPSAHRFRGVHIDYFQREWRNRSLGAAGEAVVMRFEQRRLHSGGLPRLADRVKWASKERGVGLGFDVLSFENDGRERFIEVKTTSFARETPF
ncbi:MAG: DUF3883 domain-containing protein [Acidobacteriota bacterium]